MTPRLGGLNLPNTPKLVLVYTMMKQNWQPGFYSHSFPSVLAIPNSLNFLTGDTDSCFWFYTTNKLQFAFMSSFGVTRPHHVNIPMVSNSLSRGKYIIQNGQWDLVKLRGIWQAITWTNVDITSQGFCGIHLRVFRLAHWGRVTHICVDNITTIGSDNGLSPGRHQAIIWTNGGIL